MIKQPWLLAVAALLLVVAIGFAVRQASFLMTADRTTGTVTRVDGRNTSCGSKRNRHSCTRFDSVVRYDVNGQPYFLTVDSGSARGYDQPESRASHPQGSGVRIVYSKSNPSRAYRDSFFDVWFGPLASAGGAVASALGSLSEGRRRRYGWS